MEASAATIFGSGTAWLRADFHLHTKTDKEFQYSGEENSFVGAYVDRLKGEGIGLGVVTNHNKFDLEEFKALRKKARREDIGLLPGVELSVNDGANGVHTLIVFSDSWIEGGHDHINQFLGSVFVGKSKAQYENENGRTNDNLVETLKKLEAFHRDFFVIFAHVEQASGLWHELDGGRLIDLAANPLIQRYCLGFQKVRTAHKPGEKSRSQLKEWWPRYPAEVEGSDPKSLDQIGKGPSTYIKVGEHSFEALKFALKDAKYRLAQELPKITHSHVNSIRFEGGLLNDVRVPFSASMNCIIGIQGSGKSSILECLRFALAVPFGEQAQDKDYKNELVPHVLRSGGKVVVEATDRHGGKYEIHRILNHAPDVYVDGSPRSGISIRETVVSKPLYFGQKDLSAAGKGFGQDLVEKLIGENLKSARQKISENISAVVAASDAYTSLFSEIEEKQDRETELQDVKYRLEQFDRYGIKDKLEKQLEFKSDEKFCDTVTKVADNWAAGLGKSIESVDEELAGIEVPASKANQDFISRYSAKLDALKKNVEDARDVAKRLADLKADFLLLREEFTATSDSMKNEFATTEREVLQTLSDQGVTSIQPNAYVALTTRKRELDTEIGELAKKTAKETVRREAVSNAITNLNQSWLDEFKSISGTLDAINKSQKALKVEPLFKAEKAAFQIKLENLLKGSGIKKETFQAIAAKYVDFAAIYKDLEEASKLAKTKSDVFKQAIWDNLSDVLTYQVPNTFEVTYHGRPLKSHSLGQRASAMMLFLLSQDENDLLIIDQPEDDLDSQTVYEEVVKLLRDIKVDRQFIFATHNANFPVLGDAEIVAACDLNDDQIEVQAASIDSRECQAKIVRIMEGGTEAFDRRKIIYELWNAEN